MGFPRQDYWSGLPLPSPDIAKGHDKNWLELARSKMAEDSTSRGPWASLWPYYNILGKWHTHRCQDNSETNHKMLKSGWWPSFQKSRSLPSSSWNKPPTHLPMNSPSPYKLTTPYFRALAFWGGPHSACVICVAVGHPLRPQADGRWEVQFRVITNSCANVPLLQSLPGSEISRSGEA